ncbi:uncharacterized protein JCM6883_005570 [Sporobolomyces salmoneus]|uniref:uncharacterized protein n=1 Tax=Sporobolomyces salmoneus TaxID=183962 RepID=UPI0031782437
MSSTPVQPTEGSTAPSTSGTTSSFPRSSFVPRAVKKRSTAPARPPISSLPLSTPSAPSTSVPPARSEPSSSTTPLPSIPPQEVQRLEQVLSTLEGSLSDHGLTLYRSSGMLEKFKSGIEWIHLSQVLGIAPVRALTSKLVDLKNAVALRRSEIFEVHETGYQIRRRVSKDVGDRTMEELETFELAEWDDLTVHLENIPFNSSLNAIHSTRPETFSLIHFLSSALSTRIQKLVLPILYDPKNPPDLSAEEEDQDADEEEGGGETSQAEAFRASMRAKQAEELAQSGEGLKRKPKGLPKGGGPFKGFAFVVLSNKEEVERALKEWSGKRESEGSDEAAEEEAEEAEDRMEEVEGEGEEAKKSTVKGKGKAKKELSCREKAKRGGLRAMSYARWLELKKEYLAYRRTLEKLLEAQASGELDQLRNPPDVKDQPPHLQQQQSSSLDTAPPEPPSRNKRASSPHAESSSHKRPKRERASSPSLSSLLPSGGSSSLPRHTRPLRTPSPLPPSTTEHGPLDLTSDVALSIQGAYPQGCVLWVRNVHEKSSKTSLKALFGRLLDDLQEGSGKGVEFVDYEKGLETCYIRFSSAPLAALTESHLLSTITYHLSRDTLSPVDTLSEEDLKKAQEQDLRRPIAVEMLRGERERQYWASLPESTRKAARLGAGGKVGLVKEPRGFVGGSNGEDEQQGEETSDRNGNRNGFEPSRKRKKPSRM